MREINRILCPVDLSEVSSHAAEHAIVLARWYTASVTALHVSSPVVIPATDFSMMGMAAPVLTAEDAQEVRQQVTELFRQAGEIPVEVVVESGQPARRILEYAQAMPADLLVMGTHGLSGFDHLMLGSVAERVLRRATCPVLTVPARAHVTSTLPFKRLLCPVDFSDSSRAALDFAFSLAQEADAALTIVNVLEWADEPRSAQVVPNAEYRRAVEADVRKDLEALVPDSVLNWCRPETLLLCGKAYREILRVAADDHSDLIVMGVHGRNPVDLMLFGSTTNQVVRRATCPVLTLRR